MCASSEHEDERKKCACSVKIATVKYGVGHAKECKGDEDGDPVQATLLRQFTTQAGELGPARHQVLCMNSDQKEQQQLLSNLRSCVA